MKIKFIENEEVFLAKRFGYSFKLSDRKWQLDKEICVCPHKVVERMPELMRLGYLKTLAYYASEYSPGYIKNINSLFHKWFEIVSINTIDDKAVYQFDFYLGPDKNYKLNTIKSFIIKWKKFKYPGVETTALRVMETIKITPNQTGEAVKRRDPNRGPLTETELNTILVSVSKLYQEKKIDSYLYCYIMLLVKTGRRPLQLTSLKAKDLIQKEEGYFLNIPRVKQGKDFRKEFNMIMIDSVLYENLLILINENQAFAEDKFGVDISHLKKELPIFMDFEKMVEIKTIASFSSYLTMDYLHMKNSFISRKLKRFPVEFNVLSERTNCYLELNARRFRYTLGSRMANEGASIEVIAKALDHKSINSSGIYIKNSPDNVPDIDNRLHSFFAPLAKIFMGEESVESKKSFINYILSSYGLTDDKNDGIKCLTCKNFNPWSA
ncbi:tyrosine-type recombinase/integrase [Pectobacterium aroidearum]|uniref:tyrosine-type recombinase/integrase n=1 Tax=Pectobacterium aroidearum TaxID=1201031 RepID=UPI0032EBB00A